MTYTLWIEKYAFEPPHEFEDYREEVMRKIRPKLEQKYDKIEKIIH